MWNGSRQSFLQKEKELLIKRRGFLDRDFI